MAHSALSVEYTISILLSLVFYAVFFVDISLTCD